MSNETESDDLPEDLLPSKSQRKRDVKAITELGEKLLHIADDQLDSLPYPQIIAAVRSCKKIKKGGARKRQLLFIGKLLRKVELDEVHHLIDRFDASSESHARHFHQLEIWRDRLIRQDKSAMDEIFQQIPSIDKQHLRQLTRNAIAEVNKSKQQPHEVSAPVHFRKLFRYLKTEADQESV